MNGIAGQTLNNFLHKFCVTIQPPSAEESMCDFSRLSVFCRVFPADQRRFTRRYAQILGQNIGIVQSPIIRWNQHVKFAGNNQRITLKREKSALICGKTCVDLRENTLQNTSKREEFWHFICFLAAEGGCIVTSLRN